jgi:hypothetical protein
MTNIPSHEQVRDFMSRVMSWPTDEPIGYANLHCTLTKINPKTSKPYWGGTANRTLDGFMKQLAYMKARDNIRDIYFCLSRQSSTERKVTLVGNKPYDAVMRAQANALSIKVFAIDIDFKGGANGYDNQPEALKELFRFLKEVKLPPPSIIVGSGGGMHVYWTIERPMSPDEWTPVAFQLAAATLQHNLKCDTQCTIDIARVLRVPGTYNMKQVDAMGNGMRPVTIITDKGPDYPLPAIAGPLHGYIAPAKSVTALPKRNPVAGVSDLAAGIDTVNDLPVDLKTILPECGFIKNALVTGGKDLNNPLWNMTTLVSTFTGKGGRAHAHLMARGHPGYSKDSTDELFDRKERDKEAKGLGWPGCSTIRAYGATECPTCPHNAANKSPLNFGARIHPTITPTPGAAPVANSSVVVPTIPDGYTQRSDGVILHLKDFGEGKKEWLPVSNYPMTKAWLQRDPWIFNFTTKAEFGREHQIAIDLALVETNEMRKVLQGQGMTIESLEELKRIGKLLMAWIAHLQKMKGSVISSHPFGWEVKNGALQGFIYGGMKYAANGTSPSANPDPVIASQYAPTGDRQPWIEAAAMVTSQGKSAFDAIIASAFAAPLVRFTGQSGMLMSCFSLASGVGKSTALRVAQAVWGDPVRAMQSLSDTQNSVLHKIGETRAIPLYWDELKTEQDSKKFVNTVFTISQGKEKSRLTARAAQRAPGTWQTLLVSASNESLMDIVESQTKATTAGLYRVFEYEIKESRGKWSVDPSDAQRLVSKLNDNYGQIGLEYASFLGNNFDRLEAEVSALGRELGVETNTIADERFWIATITVVLAGARYANELGFTKINEEQLKFFLLETLEQMRHIRGNATNDFKDTGNVSNVVSQFFSAMAGRHTLYTNIARTGIGRPAPGTVKPVRATDRLEGVAIRIGVEDKVVRISMAALSKWLADNSYPRHVTLDTLKDKYGALAIKGRIGSGTDFAGPQEHLLEIDLLKAKELNFIDEL